MDFALPADLVAYLAELDAFIEREIKPLEAAGRQHPLLRPPPRMGAHRFRQRRPAAAGVGGAAAARRRTAPTRAGHLRFALPEAIRRQGRLQPRDGGDPRAPRRQGPRPAQRPAERAFDRRQLPLHHHARRATAADDQKAMIDGLDHGQDTASRFGLTEPDHGSDATHMETRAVRGDPRRRRRAGASTARRCGPPACTSPPTARCSPAPRGKDGDAARHHLLPGAGQDAGREGRGISSGPSTCRPTTRASASPTSGCRMTRCSARSAAACRWRSASCTRTASARRRPRWARRSTASRRASNTPASASRSASRWPTTRRSSGRWWSWRPRPRCCAC